MKGDEGEALSQLQQVKLKEIDKKARGKARKGFASRAGKKGMGGRPPPRVRQVDEDAEDTLPAEAPSPEPETPPRQQGRPAFRVIEGGKSAQGS